MKTITKLWAGIGILILLSPLGIILPEYFKAGDAWGEWGTDSIRELTGFVPRGLEKLSGLWNAPLPDYAFKGESAGNPVFSYIVSAVIGILVVVCAAWLIGKLLKKQPTRESGSARENTQP